MKCDECGLESSREAIFQIVPQSFRRKTKTLCPACFERDAERTYRLILIGLAGAAIAGLLGQLFFPSSTLGPLLLNLALFNVCVFCSTVIHELGHAFGARLVGFRVFGIEIGFGRPVIEFVLWGMRWQFRSIPFGGATHCAPREVRLYRIRETLVILAGPLVNGLILAGAVSGLGAATAFDSGLLTSLRPADLLFFSNAALVLYSLWPHRFNTRFGNIPNDALLLWETWRHPKIDVDEMPSFSYYYEAEEWRRQKAYAQAQTCLEEGLAKFPRSCALEMMLAANLLDLKRFGEARQTYLQMLGFYGGNEEIRHILFNNIAYANLLVGDPGLLVDAELYSRLALEYMPWHAYCKGTRGSVLVEMGAYEEGLALLRDALKANPERRGQASNACYIGIAEARRGHLAESRNFFALARRLDPHCVLLDREARELERTPSAARNPPGPAVSA